MAQDRSGLGHVERLDLADAWNHQKIITAFQGLS